MWKIAAIGECMLELSNPGGSVIARNMPLRFCYGGDTLNTAVYLARLGVDCAYVTALGDDPYSDWLVGEWRDEGIRTQMVVRKPGRLPGLYTILTDDCGERSFFYWRGESPARELFTRQDAAAALFAALGDCDALYLSGITLSLYDARGLGNLFEGLEAYRAGGGRIVFDGNYRARCWATPALARDVCQRIYGLTDIALPTYDDEATLFGDDGPEAVVDRLHGLGVAEVAVKRGADGVLVSSGGQRQWVATIPVDAVVDSTAAGDSFNAGYLAARSRGLSPLEAAGVGNRLAGTVIQFPGAIIPVAKMPVFHCNMELDHG